MFVFQFPLDLVVAEAIEVYQIAWMIIFSRDLPSPSPR
jgi:hypothetical protein